MRGILALLFISFPLFAQIPAGDFTLSGSVVDSVTGAPIRNAEVMLIKLQTFDVVQHAGAEPAMPFMKSNPTGPGGEFEFTGLSAGDYNLIANKQGFTPSAQSNPQSAMQKLTASMKDVQVKLAPLGSIEGRVLDQFGEPVPHVMIQAYMRNVIDGARSLQSVRDVDTNDRGYYRVWNLQPGKYFVKAAGINGGLYMYVGTASTNRNESWEAFSPTYPGGAHDADSAIPIVIGAGTQAQADINLKMEPAHRVRGTLQNYIRHQSVVFELRQGSEVVAGRRAVLDGVTGKFEIDDVVDGVYVLRAAQQTVTRGEVPVSVKSGDVQDLSVTLWPAVTVKGVVHYLGQPTEVKMRNGETRTVPGYNCQTVLNEVGGNAMTTRAGGTLARDGNIEITNIFPGDYQVRVNCSGGYVASVMSGSLDLLANPRITVMPGSPPAPIEITVKPGGGTVKAKVALDPRPANAAVLLIPGFAASTGPVLAGARFFGADSEIALSSLAPGDYQAYLLPSGEPAEFRNPAYLQSLTGGVAVKVEDNQTAEVTLTRIVK